jgi:catechol 2,3 dioxygenase
MTVATLGHVELCVPDIAASFDHFHDVIGLEENKALREDGRRYLRGWGDWDAYTLMLTEAERRGVGHVAFQVESPDDLTTYANHIEASGYDVTWQDASVEPGQGESIRFDYPGGQELELYHEMARADIPDKKSSKLKNQPQKRVERGIGARRIDHVNVYAPNVTECSEWFQEVLDFELREELILDGEMTGQWLSVSPLVHEIAFVEEEEHSLNHVAYYLKSENDLYRAADILKHHNIHIKGGPGEHGISQANYLYHDEPSGHEVEIFAGGYLIFDPNWETVTWTEEDMPEALYWWGKGREFSGSHPHSDDFEKETKVDD